MKLPNGNHASILDTKLNQYLLSRTHPVGEAKARYFRSVGFDENHAELLKISLLEIARSAEVTGILSAPFGTKYVIEDFRSTPSNRRVFVRTVWIIETGLENPRLVTAYPI